MGSIDLHLICTGGREHGAVPLRLQGRGRGVVRENLILADMERRPALRDARHSARPLRDVTVNESPPVISLRFLRREPHGCVIRLFPT